MKTEIRIAGALALVLLAASAAPAAGPLRSGQTAPPFSLAQLDGKTLTLAKLHGKPVYINFFASWCGPCNEEAPGIELLSQRYKKRALEVVGIDDQEGKEKALEFVKHHKVHYRIALGDQRVRGEYGVLALPVHIFIDRKGIVKTYRLGEMSQTEIENAIKSIL